MIKINMEMPKSCADCRGLVVARGVICVLADERILNPVCTKKRPVWCPLKELKECKK